MQIVFPRSQSGVTGMSIIDTVYFDTVYLISVIVLAARTHSSASLYLWLAPDSAYLVTRMKLRASH